MDGIETGMPEIDKTLAWLIEQGDTRGIADLCSWASVEGISTGPFVRALEAGAAIYWARRPPIDPRLD